jgi:hypothetical protein
MTTSAYCPDAEFSPRTARRATGPSSAFVQDMVADRSEIRAVAGRRVASRVPSVAGVRARKTVNGHAVPSVRCRLATSATIATNPSSPFETLSPVPRGGRTGLARSHRGGFVGVAVKPARVCGRAEGRMGISGAVQRSRSRGCAGADSKALGPWCDRCLFRNVVRS